MKYKNLATTKMLNSLLRRREINSYNLYKALKFFHTCLLLVAVRFTVVYPKSIKRKTCIFKFIIITSFTSVRLSAVLSPLHHKRVTDGHTWAMIEEVVGPQKHPTLISCGADAWNIFSMGHVVQPRGHPRNQVCVHDSVIVFQVAGEV